MLLMKFLVVQVIINVQQKWRVCCTIFAALPNSHDMIQWITHVMAVAVEYRLDCFQHPQWTHALLNLYQILKIGLYTTFACIRYPKLPQVQVQHTLSGEIQVSRFDLREGKPCVSCLSFMIPSQGRLSHLSFLLSCSRWLPIELCLAEMRWLQMACWRFPVIHCSYTCRKAWCSHHGRHGLQAGVLTCLAIFFSQLARIYCSGFAVASGHRWSGFLQS